MQGSTDPLARVNHSLSLTPGDDAKALQKFKESKQGKAFVAWVQEQYTKCKQARTREVQQWHLNYAMYVGNQNVIIQRQGSSAGKLMTQPRLRDTSRLIINRVQPMVRTELARLLSQKPAASVIPASSEDQDLMAAMAGEQVWESLQSRKKYHVEFSKAAFWTVITGTGFLKTFWDDSVVDERQGTTGDIAFASVQPFNLFVPSLLEQEIEEQSFVLEIQVKNVDLLNYQYGGSLDKKVVATSRAASSILEEAYQNPRTLSLIHI